MKPIASPLLYVCCVLLLVVSFKARAGNGFKQNKGQITNQENSTNTNVLYLYSGNGLNIQLRNNGFSYDLFSSTNTPTGFRTTKQAPSITELEKIKVYNHRIDIDFANMQNTAYVQADNEQPDYDNYYLHGKQITGVKSYQKITYKNLYPFTDIEFVIVESPKPAFKYNIILHPGADIKKVKFLIQGAQQIIKNKNGSISFDTELGSITEKIPMSYYASQPQNNLPVEFDVKGNTLQFKADYDTTQTLVIDPTSNLIWATYYGSSDVDFCNTNGMDGQNNLYIGGYTNSTANIATNGVHQSTLAAGFDAYVVKFNANGVRLWGTYLGAGGVDVFYAMYVEPNGTVYLCGDTSSQSNLTSLGAFQTVFGGGIDDVLLAKFNSAGQNLWCTYLGGPKHDIAQAITEDSNGNVIITGHTESISGIATPGAYATAYNLNYDVFIAKFSPLGARLWGTYYGESAVDEAYGIACDAQNNIIITGASASISGISTPAAHQAVFGGYQDAFISKFNSSGTTLIWGTYYGEQGSDFGNDVEVDNQGNIFVVGITTSTTNIATAGAYQTSQGSNDDSFLAAFTSAGVRLWGTYFGGDDTDYITDLAIDANKNLLFCGSTQSSYSISTAGAYQPSLALIYYYDAYFAKFTASGKIKMATYFGGDGNDKASALVLDSFGKVYISGETTSTVGIATTGVHQYTYSGSTDAFVAKFCIPLEPKLFPTGTATICQGQITVSATPGYSNYLWNTGSTANPLVTTFTNAPATLTFVLQASDGYGCSGVSDTTKLKVDKCTSLQEMEADKLFVLYPNPGQNHLTIELQNQNAENVLLQIFSLTGQLVYEEKFTGNTFLADVSKLNKGFYFVSLKTSRAHSERRFVKE
ncbi:MAG: T9SS type A sorting domain-containing protein [Bacteroidia bacterium]|nr:T9SS type A sorting domain-containing protein [Bacteroidia bacterium]